MKNLNCWTTDFISHLLSIFISCCFFSQKDWKKVKREKAARSVKITFRLQSGQDASLSCAEITGQLGRLSVALDHKSRERNGEQVRTRWRTNGAIKGSSCLLELWLLWLTLLSVMMTRSAGQLCFPPLRTTQPSISPHTSNYAAAL